MKRTVVLCLLALLAALPAVAENPKGMVVDQDGSVTVDGEFFPSTLALQLSDTFQKNGHLRCGTRSTGHTKALPTKAASDCTLNSTTIKSEYNPASGSLYQVPVVFHVIKKTDGTGDIATSFITSQIDILNEDYRALVGTPGANGTDTKIQFFLATTDPNGNPTSGITVTTSNTYFVDPGPGATNPMKQALNWDPTRYLNLYSNDANGALGYATFPQEDAGTYQDGVVLLWSSVGRDNPDGGIYDQGRTATHEVGHYFGLLHTFQDGCGSASAPYTTGDRIADTARQQSANFNCPAGATSCSSLDPIENYMNYTQDTCMDLFTSEQTNRMRCSIINYRPNLGGSGGGGGGNTVLDNGVPKTGLAASTGGDLNYTMAVPSGSSNLVFTTAGSNGDADLYVKFGSAPTTSNYDCRSWSGTSNETCSFPSPSTGTYHVLVHAYATFSNLTLTGSYSTAAPNNPPTANFSYSANNLAVSFTDTSSDSDGTIASRSWNFGDSSTSTATNPSHTYAAAGTYTVSLTVTDDDGATGNTSKQVTVTSSSAPCTNCEHYSGTLSGSGAASIQPNGNYFYSSVSGSHQGWLTGPGGTDFDLYLYKWSGSSWTKVAQSIGSTSTEQITYSGTSGYYYWRIVSYSGSGSYDFWMKRP